MALRPNIPPSRPMGENTVAQNLWLLEYCEEQEERLTAKEQSFIEDIGPRLRAGRNLTEAQENWLKSIHEKVSF